MKSWILLIVVVVAISSAATIAVPMLTSESGRPSPKVAAPSSKPDGPAPSLVIDEKLDHHFGHMAQTSQGKHTWMFRNEGKGPLELRTLSSTCSCTLAQLGKDSKKSLVIAPGESAPIDLTWDTKMRNGAYSQSATIGTNDASQPEVILSVEGTVQPAIMTAPAEGAIAFASVGNDKPHTQRIAIYSGDRPDFKITRMVASRPDRIGIEAQPLSKGECESLKTSAGYAITVTLQPTPQLGAFSEEIVLETDHPLRTELRYKVTGRVEGPIIVTPGKVILHDATSRDGGSVGLTIWSRGQAETKFTVAGKPDHLAVAIAPLGQPDAAKSSKYRMIVSVEPNSPPGKIGGEIVLHTDNPNASEVKVPVDVLVRSVD